MNNFSSYKKFAKLQFSSGKTAKRLGLLTFPLLVSVSLVAAPLESFARKNRRLASEEPPIPVETEEILASTNNLSVGLSFVQWNEELRLQSGGASDLDSANFKGLNIQVEKKVANGNYGWALAAAVGSGIASAGGNSSLVTYQKGNQAWTSLGGSAKVFKRFTEQFELGLSVPLVFRQIKWTPTNAGLPVDSGKNVNLGLLVEMDYQISKDFSFTQAIGPFSTEGATLWRIGLSYRL